MPPVIENPYVRDEERAEEENGRGAKRWFKRLWQWLISPFVSGREVVSYIATINALKSEIDLLTSYSTDTIYRLRYDGMRYDYISPSVIRLLGYTPEELKQINLRSLILETRIVNEGMRNVESYHTLEENRKRGDVQKWQADYRIRTKDGREIWISDISYPWYGRNGAIIGSVGSLRDISDRVAAEQEINTRLMEMASTDYLTGAANRRTFFERLDKELKRLQRREGDIAILLLDIDHFKRINDTYGHDTGDRVLQEVTGLIGHCLRDTDLLARLGGEEFAAVLPDTSVEGAFWVAERIRDSIARHDFNPGNQPQPIHCTVSIGVADTASGGNLNAASLYSMADTRLYIAKNTGRNQVSLDEIVQMQ